MTEGAIMTLIRKAAEWISGLHIHCWHQIEDLVEEFPNYCYHGKIVKAERRRPQFKCCKCPRTRLSFYIIADVV